MAPRAYRWRLAELARAQGVDSGAELARRLQDHGVTLSRSQTHRMLTGRPARLSLDVTVALCAILDCSLDELIDRDTTGGRRGARPTTPGVTDAVAARPAVVRSTAADATTGQDHDDDRDDDRDDDSDDVRTGNLLGAVTLDVTERVEAGIATATGLSAIEATALTALANVADGHGIDELRSMVGLSQPGCARLVDRLSERGLVRRRFDDRDRRLVRVSLTEAGRDVVARVIAARRAALESILADVADDDREALARGLAEVARVAVDGRPERSDRFCRRCDPVACGFPYRCPATVFSSRDG